MASSFTGPLKNMVNTRGGRAFHSGLPIGAFETEWFGVFHDFLEVAADSTNLYTVIKDEDAAVAIAADTVGGVLAMTSKATTNDDGSSIQGNEIFALGADKQVWFIARAALSDADDMDAFLGLTVNFAANPEAVLAATDRVGFQVNDGNASILCKTEKNGTETSTDSGVDAADATYNVFAIHWDGKGNVKFYIDWVLVATHTTNIPDDENLTWAAFELSGSDSGTKSLSLDYIGAMQER